ncbi:MAG: Fic family protein [Oscillospiraceae bacterium]|nr:Fic family protein [Candidatus Limimonas egerieequi]
MEYKDLVTLFHMDKDLYALEYKNRFNSDNSVKLNYDVKGNQAFFVVNNEVSALILSILRLDKQVLAYSADVPGVALKQYSNKSLIDEIVITNNIEGVHSTRKEVGDVLDILQLQSVEANKENRFFGLIDRYLKMRSNDNISLKTSQDIRNLYDEIVLPEVLVDDKDNMPDGEIFRKSISEIQAPTGKVIHYGKEPESNIIKYMGKALSFLNDNSIEPLYRACIFHYMIEDIHPFYDGNGRLGRFIFSYVLSKNLEPLIAYHISKTIKNNIGKYYKAFEICDDERNKGDLTSFLIMMLTMIKEAYLDLLDSLKQSMNAWGYYEKTLFSHLEPQTKQMQLLYSLLIQAALFSEDGISMQELLSEMKIAYGTLVKRLAIVESQDLLVSFKKGVRNYYKINLDTIDNFSRA